MRSYYIITIIETIDLQNYELHIYKSLMQEETNDSIPTQDNRDNIKWGRVKNIFFTLFHFFSNYHDFYQACITCLITVRSIS